MFCRPLMGGEVLRGRFESINKHFVPNGTVAKSKRRELAALQICGALKVNDPRPS